MLAQHEGIHYKQWNVTYKYKYSYLINITPAVLCRGNDHEMIINMNLMIKCLNVVGLWSIYMQIEHDKY